MPKIQESYIRDDFDILAKMDLWPLTNNQLIEPSLETLLFPNIDTRKDTSEDEELFYSCIRKVSEFFKLIHSAFQSGEIKDHGSPQLSNRGRSLDSISQKEKWGRPIDILIWMQKKNYFVPKGLIESLRDGNLEKVENLLRQMRAGFHYWLEHDRLPKQHFKKEEGHKKLIQDFFPAPQGTHWDKIGIQIKASGIFEIKIGKNRKSFKLSEIKTLLPSKKSRESLLMIIHMSGDFDREDFQGPAKEHFPQYIHSLRNDLKKLFGIEDDPILSKGSGQYQCKFSVTSKIR